MKNAANFCIVIISTLLALIVGQSLIMPFLFAFFLWFLTREFRKQLDRLAFVKKHLPNWLKNIIVFTLMIWSIGFIAEILSNNILTLSASYEKYQTNVESTILKIEENFNINLEQSINDAKGKFEFGNILKSILNALSGMLGNAFMIIIYAIFIFLEESNFKEKLKKILIGEGQHEKFNSVLSKIELAIFDYIRLKTIVSFLTGLLSYLVLHLIGIDSPFFWAFLIFLLNYIPTVGSLFATIFPALYSLIQFGEFSPFIITLLSVGAVQLIVGNIIEPKVMGKSLNISPLVTILALAVWGKIWGITGMVLSVPITVVMIIVFSQVEKTKALAIMLTENGKIE